MVGGAGRLLAGGFLSRESTDAVCEGGAAECVQNFGLISRSPGGGHGVWVRGGGLVVVI